jgi:hypothetical protein
VDRMISFCGLSCTDCPAFIATVNDDDEMRKRTAEQWSKDYGVDIKPEDINCDGCVLTEGRHIGHWNECEIRICGQGRGVENCAYCNDFACEKLTQFFKTVPEAQTTLEDIKKMLEP